MFVRLVGAAQAVAVVNVCVSVCWCALVCVLVLVSVRQFVCFVKVELG